jgi:NAD(P)-dependent dehydrogenase (short-subunit alcohol dehydrogenase family)
MKATVVLGAGIAGRALAERVAAERAVIVVDSAADRAEEVARQVRAGGGVAEAYGMNLMDLTVTAERASDLAARYEIDIVAHLVGGWQGSPGLDAEALAAYSALAGPLLTTVQVTSVAFRDAIAASGGRFVLVTSTAKPTAGNAAYTSAKAGAQTWVRAMAHSLRGTEGAACVIAVKALVDDRMRAAEPQNTFAGYTDVRDLANAIVETVHHAPGEQEPGWLYFDLTGTA